MTVHYLPTATSSPRRGNPGAVDADASAPSVPAAGECWAESGASPPRYLTAPQLADMLQVDDATVYRWAEEDASMPATRIGRTVRFEARAIERWLAARTQRSRRS